MSRFLRLTRLGARSLMLHPMRSFLTVLGIIIGVGAVIYMLAILEGDAQQTQEQIRARGATNIIVRSKPPAESSEAQARNERMIVYGVTDEDFERIRGTIPGTEDVIPVRDLNNSIYANGRKVDTVAICSVPAYRDITRARLARGSWYSSMAMDYRRPVAVLGSELTKRLFTYRDPVGKTVRIGSKPYEVIGVLEPTMSSEKREATKKDLAAFVPLTSISERFGDRNIKRSSGSLDIELVDLHEVIVKMSEISLVKPTALLIEDMMRKHHKEADYVLDVPYRLLEEARQKAIQDQIRYGTIAAISLLVGGIGIMNIMLASVTERTREIGIRRALGALRRDIILQFLMETVILAVIGGIIGILGGIVASEIHEARDDKVVTIVTSTSVLLSFGIASLVGVLAGIYPAIRAARMDPIVALRYE